ncbi:sensor histidine kinase [Microlunatus capsulatus]|uniref:Signal transduction histidine kinase n=1 Tax=Microlunatus capsulatus TaxID=99117 RepID=A0ABS4Z8Z4_9ACTN|nr:ATP-binding protein [Microlunatus capsulatus]MBP2417526.1 signal transduction histidine kinase [Microlunatus capsulatus]
MTGVVGVPTGPDLGATASLLADPAFVRLVRGAFTARLVCLALAAPAALTGPGATAAATASLLLLTASSLVLSRSGRTVRLLIAHPLAASADVALAVALLLTVGADQPAALTVVCSALAVGLLFPRRVLVALVAPLAVGSLGAPAALLGAGPVSWQAGLALLAGLPALVLGLGGVGAVVRHSVEGTLRARSEVALAVAAVGAAEERARLARAMHDSVGKSLHGISLGAKALTRVAGQDQTLTRDLSRSLADAADQAAREARALLVTLREDTDDRPTVDVVASLLRTFEADTGVATSLHAAGAVDADPAVTGQLAAALGELLHNVARHARATRVDVRLDGDATRVRLTVRDDGVGFRAPAAGTAAAPGHYGLRGVHERARAVGGDVDVDSEPGKGTCVRWTASRHPRTSSTKDVPLRLPR